MYECSNCHKDSATLISHPEVTGRESFYPECFFQMCNTLADLRKECPICRGSKHVHRNPCLYGTLQANLNHLESTKEVYA